MVQDIYRCRGKRYLEMAISFVALLMTTPLMVLCAVLVRLDSRGGILFVQERVGRHGQRFRLYKFRTMIDRPRETVGEIIGRHGELTRVGYWLRRFKIDELPQLFNVVRGEMSLVGPRPWLPSAWDESDPRQRRRCRVAPGLTGLAQVNGNIHLSREDRVTYDLQYSSDLSASLDLRILARTFAVVLFGEDAFLQSPLGRPLPSAAAAAPNGAESGEPNDRTRGAAA